MDGEPLPFTFLSRGGENKDQKKDGDAEPTEQSSFLLCRKIQRSSAEWSRTAIEVDCSWILNAL